MESLYMYAAFALSILFTCLHHSEYYGYSTFTCTSECAFENYNLQCMSRCLMFKIAHFVIDTLYSNTCTC